MEMHASLEDRLVRYCAIDTGADESSETTPSTAKQFDLLNLLVTELQEMGAQDVVLTSYGAVLATIPATVEAAVPTVAFLAHVDTSPAYATGPVKPIVHRAWDGSDIVLPNDTSKVLRASDLPYLQQKVGDDIVTASGDTLLGADDKAGVAIVMELTRQLLRDPAVRHGRIRVCFTPDEEIGRGVDPNLPKDLGADFAYTLDGADLGEVTYETFSADKAVVSIDGVSTHPGDAKDAMVNALHLAADIVNRLNVAGKTPETTAGRDGFVHVYNMSGGAAHATLEFIIRAFEMDELNALGASIQQAVSEVQTAEPRATLSCSITQQYRNMRYWLENDMQPVELARKAVEAHGIQVQSQPIRGGTDGSRLTEMGVPTPNLFTGMQNFHGPLEWVSIQDMAKATEVCMTIATMAAEGH